MIGYRHQQLYIAECPARELAARYGTPLYVYSGAVLDQRCASYTGLRAPFPVTSYYAVKANPNLALLSRIRAGGLGFDVVSGGELERCLRIGADPAGIVYSGVGKSTAELSFAIQSGVGSINLESEGECDRVLELAATVDTPVRLSIRVNPDIAVHTHPYIATALATSKFGVPPHLVQSLAQRIAQVPNCRLTGIGCHLGSMIEDIQPLVESCRQLVALTRTLAPRPTHISIGGGLAVRYQQESQPQPQQLIDACIPILQGSDLTLQLEPGRSVVADCGIILTRVEYCKHGAARNFAIVDAAMNDLLRPSLYRAWHTIETVIQRDAPARSYDIVGPICETGDYLGQQRSLAIQPGDLLAVMTTGAYAASMASNYNCRPRAAAVLIDGREAKLIARRETTDDLCRTETELSDPA